MSVQERKERERADRHRLIVSEARALAESEGWDAVTTRRLADRIEYSQPVLYSHFRGKDEIVAAVALQGFVELAAALRGADPAEAGPVRAGQRAAVAALAGTYVAFAERHPAVYDAMFSMNVTLAFADPASPAPLHEAFGALSDTLREVAGPVDPDLFTEVCWAALHGLVTLTRAERLRPELAEQRLEVIVDLLVGR